MILQSTFIFLSTFVFALSLPNPRSVAEEYSYRRFNLITRIGWKARPPRSITTLNAPVQLVIIHHSYQPSACHNTNDCSRAMRSMQDHHQITNGWEDIGYNFAVGSDGLAYEGRGWNRVGAHAFGFNSRSVGIVLIGDWRFELPPEEQLMTTKQIIATGVELGYISPNYKIMGHRQVSATECPGEALFQEISTWDHFTTEL